MHISLGIPNVIVTVPDLRVIGVDSTLLNETKKFLEAVQRSIKWFTRSSGGEIRNYMEFY